VHFIVMDGPYKGVGKRDGSRLMIDGRATAPVRGIFRDHGNDLIEEWPGDAMVSTESLVRSRLRPTVSQWSSISRLTDGHRRKRSSR
jgi:hypothetical protein